MGQRSFVLDKLLADIKSKYKSQLNGEVKGRGGIIGKIERVRKAKMKQKNTRSSPGIGKFGLTAGDGR